MTDCMTENGIIVDKLTGELKKEDYDLLECTAGSRKDVTVELSLLLARTDERPISFDDEWPAIQHACKEAGFIAIPIDEALENEYADKTVAEIFCIKDNELDTLVHTLLALCEELKTQDDLNQVASQVEVIEGILLEIAFIESSLRLIQHAGTMPFHTQGHPMVQKTYLEVIRKVYALYEASPAKSAPSLSLLYV